MPHQSKQFKESVDRNEKITVLSSDDTEAANRPDYESTLYRSQLEDVGFVRTVYGGTKALRGAGKTYLPKHGSESQGNYDKRLEQSVALNAYKRTIQALTGMVFRKDPIFDEATPDVIAEDAENVDLAGRDLPTFARDTFENALNDGHTYILVDYPKADGRFTSRREERDSGVRPYWINLTKREVINLRWEMRDGRPVLTLAVYVEEVREPAGKFGEEKKTRYRVLRPGEQQVWEKRETEDKTSLVLVDEAETSIDYIPLYTIYTNRTGLFQSEPPLLDLAYENVGHYQVRSDHRYGLSFAMVPVPFITGVESSAFVWGPGQSITLEDTEADAKILESTGAALGESRQELKDIEGRMAFLGLQMLMAKTNTTAQTATERLLDKVESDATLADAARNLQNGLNQVLEAHADYRNVGDAGMVAINRDFHQQMIDPQTANVLSGMVERGQISLETLWDILQTGEILPEDFDPEMERERIQVTGPMNDLLALTQAGAGRENEPPLPEEEAA